MSVLFIGKADDFYCERARELLLLNFPDAMIVLGRRRFDQPLPPLPEQCRGWQGDYIISYLSPWVIPADVLSHARVAAINFHPGPPEYPGIGCTNFAIYNSEKAFGVTCHHMAAKVDSGSIIAVRRFDLLKADSVWSLSQRCYAHIFVLFSEIIAGIVLGRGLPRSEESWRRRPYRRTELEELQRVRRNMSDDEVARPIRATTFPGAPGAYCTWPEK